MNMKMLLAPVLAITLAVLLAAAINSLSFTPASEVYLTSTSEPTVGAVLPTAAPQAASTTTPSYWLLYVIGAVLVGFVAILLFFREKSLSKSLTQ